MENIKVINNHFVVISDKRDFDGWHYKVYTIEGITVSYGEKYISELKDRPTEEQCLRQYFQHKRDILQKRLTDVSAKKLTIDKVLEQLDDFEKLIEINTVLKSDSKFSVGDEVYVKFWDEDGIVTSVSKNSLFVQFRTKGTKPFNKKGEWLGEIPAAEATLQQLVKDTTIRKLVPIPEDVKIGDKLYSWQIGAVKVVDAAAFTDYVLVVEKIAKDGTSSLLHVNKEGTKVLEFECYTSLKLIQY